MAEPADTQHCESGDRSVPAEKQLLHTWSSQQLLGDSKEARIVHGEETYRLIRTRNDKLILVK